MEKPEAHQSSFYGLTFDKAALFSEMKHQLRTCSIPSLAPTSRFKKKSRRILSAPKTHKKSPRTLLNQSGASSQGGLKSIIQSKKSEIRAFNSKLPDSLKFYGEFLSLGLDFDGSKKIFKDIKKNKIRSTFGGSEKVDQKLEEKMSQMYGLVHQLSAICNQLFLILEIVNIFYSFLYELKNYCNLNFE